MLGVRSQEVGTFAFLLCNVRTESGVRRGVPEFLERLTAVFIWVDHSRDVAWLVPTGFLVMAMWFINLKSALNRGIGRIYTCTLSLLGISYLTSATPKEERRKK